MTIVWSYETVLWPASAWALNICTLRRAFCAFCLGSLGENWHYKGAMMLLTDGSCTKSLTLAVPWPWSLDSFFVDPSSAWVNVIAWNCWWSWTWSQLFYWLWLYNWALHLHRCSIFSGASGGCLCSSCCFFWSLGKDKCSKSCAILTLACFTKIEPLTFGGGFSMGQVTFSIDASSPFDPSV